MGIQIFSSERLRPLLFFEMLIDYFHRLISCCWLLHVFFVLLLYLSLLKMFDLLSLASCVLAEGQGFVLLDSILFVDLLLLHIFLLLELLEELFVAYQNAIWIHYTSNHHCEIFILKRRMESTTYLSSL